MLNADVWVKDGCTDNSFFTKFTEATRITVLYVTIVFNASFVKIVFSFWTNYEMFPFACFFLGLNCIMYLVLALLKVALVSFT